MQPSWIKSIGICALLIAIGGCHGHSPESAARSIDWRTSPLDLNLRGMIGAHYRFHCSPGKPLPDLLTGSGVYTDSSSICTAAVHAGAINPQQGGDVVIQILSGQPSYQGSTQNFVHSNALTHAWSGGFAVLGNSP